MKRFEMRELGAALSFAQNGGQALHLHSIVFPGSPRCFREAVARGEQIGHLFDMDRDRLSATARRLGVRVLKVDRGGTTAQHIDLCAGPLRQALALCDGEG